MTIAHVGSTAWVTSVNTVTPTIDAATADGDLMIMTLVSKYETAVLPSDPVGWTDMGPIANAGRSAGNDNGNLRMRSFYRVFVAGDTAPTLSPSPNNVSAAKISTYSKDPALFWDLTFEADADDTVGTPLVLATASDLNLAAGDVLHIDEAINGDVVTWGTGTLTVTGCTMSAATTNVADQSTTSGTDMNMRSVRYTVSSGTSSAGPSLSTVLAGTTTNAVGVGVFVRLREKSGVAYTDTEADTENLDDLTTTEIGYERALPESEDLTDSQTFVYDFGRAPVDDAGLGDTVSTSNSQQSGFWIWDYTAGIGG